MHSELFHSTDKLAGMSAWLHNIGVFPTNTAPFFKFSAMIDIDVSKAKTEL